MPGSWVPLEISSHWGVFSCHCLRVLHPLGVFLIFKKSFTSCTCYLGVQAWCLPLYAPWNAAPIITLKTR
uniref:Uncharacterized protein n=1 Tax=Anguilla anguilla TaxID=7936 RepID=A0A0E9UG85_ANGAN